MATAFQSFNRSTLGAFIQSSIDPNARGGGVPEGDLFVTGNFSNWNSGEVSSTKGLVRWTKSTGLWSDASNGIANSGDNGKFLILDSVLYVIDPSTGLIKHYKQSTGEWISLGAYPSGFFLPNRILNYDGKVCLTSPNSATKNAIIWNGSSWDEINTTFRILDAVVRGGILYACGGENTGDGFIGKYEGSWTTESSTKMDRLIAIEVYQGNIFTGWTNTTHTETVPTSNIAKWIPGSGFTLVGGDIPSGSKAGLQTGTGIYIIGQFYIWNNELLIHPDSGAKWTWWQDISTFKTTNFNPQFIFKYSGSDYDVVGEVLAGGGQGHRILGSYGDKFLCAGALRLSDTEIPQGNVAIYDGVSFAKFADSEGAGAGIVRAAINIGRTTLIDLS